MKYKISTLIAASLFCVACSPTADDTNYFVHKDTVSDIELGVSGSYGSITDLLFEVQPPELGEIINIETTYPTRPRVIYSPPVNFTGTDQLSYSVTDTLDGDSDTADISIFIGDYIADIVEEEQLPNQHLKEGNLIYAFGSEFLIYDISNPNDIQLISSTVIDTQRTNNMVKAGDIIYVAKGDQYGGVLMINVSDLQHPTLVGEFQAEGRVWSLYAKDSLLFVGRAEQQNLRIYDISDPINPAHISNANVQGITRGINVKGNVLFIASSGVLEAFDITDIENPVQIYSYDSNYDESAHITIHEDVLYWGTEKHFIMMDVSDPFNTTLIKKMNGVFTEDVAVIGNTAYVAGSISGLFMVDITDKSSPKLMGRFAGINGTEHNTLLYSSSVSSTESHLITTSGTDLVIINHIPF